MPRMRSGINRGLPKRWSFRRGKYYYQVPTGEEQNWDGKKLFLLGAALHIAYQEWSTRLSAQAEKAKTISELLDRYELEVLPTKAPATQKGNIRDLKKLRATFGEMPIGSIRPHHIYEYASKRSRIVVDGDGKKSGGPRSAKLEVSLLSHVYSEAIRWGILHKHPFKGEVKLKGSKPRTRYIEDWEIEECLALSSDRRKGSVKAIQAYIKIKLLTGLDQSDLLRIQMTDLKEDGLHNHRHKTAERMSRKTIYQWTDELKAAVEEAKAARPAISNCLFCTKYGEGFINEKTGQASGWDSMWQRFMKRLLDETKITERFTSHDLRAKAASDAKDLEHARALLSHADSKITNRVYRRKPEMVRPIR